MALAGCGSSKQHDVTVPAYGEHPATTLAAAPADPAACGRDAVAFGNAARDFLAHSGPKAAYPADLWLVLLRESLADFQARDCDPAVLKRALDRRLSSAELARLAEGLPESISTVLRGL